jgi:hypothetical protein
VARKAAKDRLRTLRPSQPAAKLADAQLAVAREHGFPSWRALKAHVDALGAARPARLDAGVALSATSRCSSSCASSRPDRWTTRARLDRPARWSTPSARIRSGGGRPQPLHVAIESNHDAAFDLLLERGASPTDRTTPTAAGRR